MNGHDPLLGQSGLSGHHHHRSDLMGPGRHNGGHLLGGGDDEEEEEEEDDDDDEHRHEGDGIGDMQDRFEDEWSKEGFMEKDWKMEGGNVEVDQTPLQNQLKKNKESLAVKLKLRRPMGVLVEQGILPQYKTSPSLHEQRTKLERAQMGDRLRQKIASRPDRQELVHRHILEDFRPDVDPSLCSKQRQLKRAKLADSLASQLSHRPGPLELIQKNILHTDDPVEQLVKQGSIAFTPTAEGVTCKAGLVVVGDGFSGPAVDEDSSDAAPSPLAPGDLVSDSSSSNVPALLTQFSDPSASRSFECVGKSSRSESLGDINASRPHHPGTPVDAGLLRSESFGGSGSDLTALVAASPFGVGSLSELACGPHLQREFPGKDRKKAKVKKPVTVPKPRTIKFHEYKGPESYSLKRKMEEKKSQGDTAYDLLLKQQQLFLQWQLENQNKYPGSMYLPANSRSSLLSLTSSMSTSPSLLGSSSASLTSSSQTSSPVPSPASSVPGTPRSSTPIRSLLLTPQDVNHATSLLNRLDDMKVTELKLELKKRNLAVSGPKPTLVERLRPILEGIIAAGRQQFQQPYKQISIPPGGLIILKPSPNSQLLTQTESNSNQVNGYDVNNINGHQMSNTCNGFQLDPPTPQAMHEGTPESGDDTPMTPMNNNPFSPISSILSPTGSMIMLNNNNSSLEDDLSEQSQLDELLQEGMNGDGNLSPSTASHMELDFNLNLMEAEQQQQRQQLPPPPAPPPPPPPPPPPSHSGGSQQQQQQVAKRPHGQPKLTVNPAPLPGPPHVTAAGIITTTLAAAGPVATTTAASLSPLQFVLPAKTNQQILLAKQQLESQLAGPAQPASIPPPSVRAGPKGQFIWPPVSIQSSQGTVTIRARNTPTSSEAEQRMSSTPVAQLAAVFSSVAPATVQSSPAQQLQAVSNRGSTTTTLQPQLRQQSVAAVLLPSQLSSSNHHHLLGVPVQLSQSSPGQLSQGTPVQLSRLSNSSFQLPRTIRLPQEPVPASELGLTITRSSLVSSIASSFSALANSNSAPVVSSSRVLQLPASQLPATLPSPGHSRQGLARDPARLLSVGLAGGSRQGSPSDPAQLPATLPTIHMEQGNAGEPEDILQKTEDIIKQQQQQIEQLQQALQQSQQQLLAQQQSQQLPTASSMKSLLAQQLQKKQLAAQIQQLQQLQEQQRHQQQQQQEMQAAAVVAQKDMVLSRLAHCGDPKIQEVPGPASDSMDDVLEIILRNGDDALYPVGCQPGAPPPPPPPPAGRGRSSPPPPRALDLLPLPRALDFPQLDLVDLSFDLGQLPDLPAWGQEGGGAAQEDRMMEVQPNSSHEMGESMEVDMDVGDWLDSLLPSAHSTLSNGCHQHHPANLSCDSLASLQFHQTNEFNNQNIARNLK